MATKSLETNVLLRYVDEAMRNTNSATPTELARKAKVAPSTLTRMLGAEGPLHHPRGETLRALERASRTPLPPELHAIAHPDLAGAPQGAAEGEMNIPVRALVGTRHEGLFHLNREPFEWARRLPGLARRLRVYAVRMPDDSMTPWRQPNELVHVDPTWAVSDGCHVLVSLANTKEANGDEFVCIRRFRGRDRQGGVALLERYGVLGEVDRVPQNQILSMHRILEWAEVVGG